MHFHWTHCQEGFLWQRRGKLVSSEWCLRELGRSTQAQRHEQLCPSCPKRWPFEDHTGNFSYLREIFRCQEEKFSISYAKDSLRHFRRPCTPPLQSLHKFPNSCSPFAGPQHHSSQVSLQRAIPPVRRVGSGLRQGKKRRLRMLLTYTFNEVFLLSVSWTHKHIGMSMHYHTPTLQHLKSTRPLRQESRHAEQSTNSMP